MLKKINNRILLTELLMGVGLFILIKGLIEKNKEPLDQFPKLIGNMNSSYVPQYFKDREYFGNNAPPKDHYANWKVLVQILDKIRTAYGSAIIIASGYQPSYDGVIRDPFSNATRAWIFPKNMDINRLHTVVKTLVNAGKINPLSWKMTDNKMIEINI